MENKVYILHLEWEFDYDKGSEIEGVFATFELAKKGFKNVLTREYETSWISEYLDENFIPIKGLEYCISEYIYEEKSFYLADKDGAMTNIWISEHTLKK